MKCPVLQTAERLGVDTFLVYIIAYNFTVNLHKVECDRGQAMADYDVYASTKLVSRHVEDMCRAIKHDLIPMQNILSILEDEIPR